MKLRWLFWSLVLGIAAFFYLNEHPLIFSESEPLYTPLPPVSSLDPTQPNAHSDVLLVVDTQRVLQSASFSSFVLTDWSYAWENTLEQEFGPYTVIDRPKLDSIAFKQYRFVIFTSSVATADTSPQTLQKLRDFVSSGGTLILERPSGSLRASFSGDGKRGQEPARAVTAITESLSDPYRTHLARMPLKTTWIGSSSLPRGAQPLLSMDNTPVVYRLPFGQGSAITIDFNFGLQLTSLQQGTPRDDFSLPPNPNQPQHHTWDLVASTRMHNTPIPYADLLEKFLVHVAFSGTSPVVGVWPFQHEAAGAFLMTHDIHTPTHDSGWMTQWEHERIRAFSRRGLSTLFLSSRPNERNTILKLRKHSHLQPQWVFSNDPDPLLDLYGISTVQPFAQTRPLQQQIKSFKGIFSKKHNYAVNATRTRNASWSEHYTHAFQALAEAKIPLDTSYNPTPNNAGYAFGTGLPFRPLSPQGLPIPIHELPILFNETQEDPTQNSHMLARILRDSQASYHNAIQLRFNPKSYSDDPSVSLFDQWQTSFDLAEDFQHAPLSTTAFIRAWNARKRTSMVTRVQRDPDAGEGALVLIIEAESSTQHQSITVPASLGDRTFQYARLGRRRGDLSDLTQPLPTTRTNILSFAYYIIPLREGYNSITATYR